MARCRDFYPMLDVNCCMLFTIYNLPKLSKSCILRILMEEHGMFSNLSINFNKTTVIHVGKCKKRKVAWLADSIARLVNFVFHT